MITTLQSCFGVNMNKNVILILVDQMRGDCIGANGNESIMTTFLDELAYEGINFTNEYHSNQEIYPVKGIYGI